jgi:enamine deaminase RidA (YjgF/YER057c/UK114 family)
MPAPTRLHPGPRYSEVSLHRETLYLSGQVADDASQDIRGQTAQVLAAVERLLAEAGSDKSHLLMAQVFLADLADYDGMNAVWDAWIAPGPAPCRATVQARLARPEWRVEIVVTAALREVPSGA